MVEQRVDSSDFGQASLKGKTPEAPTPADDADGPHGDWQPSLLNGLLVAVGLSLAAAGLRWLLHPLIGDTAHLALFIPVILVAALYGGFWPGLLATVLAANLGWFVFLRTSEIADGPRRISAMFFVGVFLAVVGARVNAERRRADIKDRELRAALRRSRGEIAAALHSRVLESMAEGVFIFDGEGRITFANPALAAMFGVEREQLVGKNAAELIGDDERKSGRAKVCDLNQCGDHGSWSGELWQVRGGGERFLTRASVTELPSAHKSFVCVLEDVTQRRRADEALRDANRRLQLRVEELASLLNVLPIGIGIAEGTDCAAIQINPSLAKILRLPVGGNASLTAPDADRPRHFRVLRDGEEVPHDQLPMQLAAREGVATHDLELDVAFDDGSVSRLLEYAIPLFDEQGATRGSIGAFVDITERRQIEQEREQLVDRLTQRTRKLVLLSQAVREVNEDLNQPAILRSLVRSALQITDAPWGMAGLRRDDKLLFNEYFHGDEFTPLNLVYHVEDPLGVSAWVMRTRTHYLSNDVAADTVVRPELRERFDIRTLVNLPILGRRNELLGCLELHNKVEGFTTEDCVKLQTLAAGAAIALQNAELFQRIREADRRKDDFLAMLAHELRNPLAPLRTSLDYLGALGDADPTTSELREIMSRQVAHMGRIIDDLLDVSRINRGRIELRREPVDLARLAGAGVAAQRNVCRHRNLTFVEQFPAQSVWADVDETRIAQVLDNLLTNAAKFSEDGGTIVVAITENLDAEEVALSVTDSGIGISPDDLPRIFDIFTQADRSLDRSSGGLGLGLALVKGLTELHGGRVVAESEGPGRGSTFTVYLPAVVAPQPPTPPVAPTIVGRGMRVLIVEDNRDAAATLRMILERHGHMVVVAHAGPDGLASAGEFRPEVVVCDIGLPGMDGYSVAASLRADSRHGNVRLIALSGYGREEDRVRAMHAGFDDHLTKPVETSVLLRLIGESAAATGR